MSDCKTQLISDVTTALVSKLDPDDIDLVSDEMLIALKDYQVTKNVTELVQYDGFNEMILKRYRACLVISGRSPKTIEAYDRQIKILFRVLQKNFTDMTVSDLRYFLALEKSRGVSNRTLENTRIVISSFFTWLLDEDLINKNPCHFIKPIKYTSKVRYSFSSVEIDALRSACKNTKERAIIELLLASGIRVSELCSMRVVDIDFDTRIVIVLNGKGDKQRTVYINDLAREHLLAYLNTRNVSGEYLFYNKKKEPLNPGGVRFILKSLEERSGVTNVHPHRFRRTLATNLSNRGMDVQEISKLLGHADINTTMGYIYTSDESVHVSYMKYAS